MSQPEVFRVLLIEDDPETLELFKETLPDTYGGSLLRWDFAGSFDSGLSMIQSFRYDLVATDVYHDRPGMPKGPLTGQDKEAIAIISELRRLRFAPIVVFSDSVLPATLTEGPFLQFADKSGGDEELLRKIIAVIDSGIPSAARQIHDALDVVAADYMWQFLDQRWGELDAAGLAKAPGLISVLSRRAATILGRLDETGSEREQVLGVDYYLYPRIARSELRLGDVVKTKEGRWGVLLTPHCHLARQAGADRPKVESALVAWAQLAQPMLEPGPWANKEARREEQLRKRVKSPPDELPSVQGRYWFLPPFLDIPALYVDFMDLTPVGLDELAREDLFDRVATLDTPYAEAFQSCFLRFYGAVGLPNLDLSALTALIPVTA